jgi:arabinogalactan oligomer/maltooligosaccharide transport system substrate-binding protein
MPKINRWFNLLLTNPIKNVIIIKVPDGAIINIILRRITYMKMSKILALVLAVVMVVACFAACNTTNNNGGTGSEGTTTGAAGGNNTENPNAALAGTYDITLWVSEKEGVAALTQQQIDAFEAANPGIVINAQIEGVTEADAGSKVVADVATAPDIYCFAQDQLARLVQAAALAKPGKNAAATIKANNDAGSVAAASVAGELYAYPMTSDNGYYMYYDTSIISEEDAESLEKIIAACEKSGKKFRYALENAWYTASFFFATGCKSNWTMDAEGNFNAVDDDFNSAAGLAAMKGMQKLAQSSCYDSNADIFTDAGVVITGIWNAEAAENHFGANFGATDLPSFTVDGKSYHLGSYTGNKLMGVKPQTDAKKAAVLSLLAQYLTGEECQNQRYAQFQWGPSNLAAQQSEAVQSNPSLAALAKQNAFGQPQGQIHGAWWDIAKVLGADAKAATSDAELQTALDEYKAAIEALFSMTEEERNAWGVIGGICGTSWDTDFPMTEGPDGTYTSDVLALNAGEEFKVRQGASWDVNFGVEFNGANIVVETTGNYKVQLVWDGAQGGTVTLIPVE